MRIAFTKMQGAGNDFVVLDATRMPFALDAAQIRKLADRRFGVGADQLLVVEPATKPGADFAYRIFNGGSGEEVEHCGNGARCFVLYVREHGLSDKRTLVVDTVNRRLELMMRADGRVAVDMGAPVFEPDDGPLDLGDGERVDVTVLSMGNPHAVQRVADVETAPVARQGPLVERHPRFPHGVNAGFMQVVSRGEIALRVFERGAGETLACGTGACAAVATGIRRGWLDTEVDVHTRGGLLHVAWPGGNLGQEMPVVMTGPAETVFEGAIDL